MHPRNPYDHLKGHTNNFRLSIYQNSVFVTHLLLLLHHCLSEVAIVVSSLHLYHPQTAGTQHLLLTYSGWMFVGLHLANYPHCPQHEVGLNEDLLKNIFIPSIFKSLLSVFNFANKMWGYIANNSSMLQNVSCYCTPYTNIFWNSLSSAKLIITL